MVRTAVTAGAEVAGDAVTETTGSVVGAAVMLGDAETLTSGVGAGVMLGDDVTLTSGVDVKSGPGVGAVVMLGDDVTFGHLG